MNIDNKILELEKEILKLKVEKFKNSKVYQLGSLVFGGLVIMETTGELVIELPCNIFIRVSKKQGDQPASLDKK